MAQSSPVRVLLNSSASPRSDDRKSPPSKESSTPPSSPSRVRRPKRSTPLCEGCQSPHDASYGSGRFCSVHCARRVAASTKWHKQRMRARVKRQPSQKSATRTAPSHSSTHSTPFLLPASAAPMPYYQAPVTRVAYDATFVPQLVALPFGEMAPVAVGVATAPYQQAEQLVQHMVPCANCVTPYAALGAGVQPKYTPRSASRVRTPMAMQPPTSAAAASIACPHQLFQYPSFKHNCANPLTNCTRRNESHAVAEALLRLRSSHNHAK